MNKSNFELFFLIWSLRKNKTQLKTKMTSPRIVKDRSVQTHVVNFEKVFPLFPGALSGLHSLRSARSTETDVKRRFFAYFLCLTLCKNVNASTHFYADLYDIWHDFFNVFFLLVFFCDFVNAATEEES